MQSEALTTAIQWRYTPQVLGIPPRPSPPFDDGTTACIYAAWYFYQNACGALGGSSYDNPEFFYNLQGFGEGCKYTVTRWNTNNCPAVIETYTLWAQNWVIRGSYCPPGMGDNYDAVCVGPDDLTPPKMCPVTPNPVQVAKGWKLWTEKDFDMPLEFVRYYTSRPSYGLARTGFGVNWRSTYDRSISLTSDPKQVWVARHDGALLFFRQDASGAWVSAFPTGIRLSSTPSGFVLVTENDDTEIYNRNGVLQSITTRDGRTISIQHHPTGILSSVTDDHGRSLAFAIDSDKAHIASVTDPNGKQLQFQYTTSDQLGGISWVDQNGVTRQRTYLYEQQTDSTLLTGIVEENGDRYSSYAYYPSGQVRSTVLWSDATRQVNQRTFTYPSNKSSTVTSPLGSTVTYSFALIAGAQRMTGSSEVCPSCGAAGAQSISYDTSGYLQSATNFNNVTTNYTYDDARGLETQRVEAVGTVAQRTVNTTWNPNFRVPDQRSVVNANNVTESSTKWAYNSRGQTLARCEIDPAASGASNYACGSSANAPSGVRQWTYTYCEQADVNAGTCPLVGLMKSVDGPRTDVSDVTTYTYYQTTDLSGCATLGGTCHYLGDLQKVTNALGQVTTYVSYDKNGRVTRLQDANGTYTDMTYHPRGWLLTRTVRANADGSPNASLDATTTFTYDNVGNVTKVTQPDGAYLAYTYDAAHRLTDIADNLNDTIHYTLDAAGNRTNETTKDPGGNIKRSLSRQYDQLNHLIAVLNSANAAVQRYTNPADAPPTGITYTDGYDGNGNAIYSVDGNGVGTEQQYDPLNRLVKTLQDHAGTGSTRDTTTQYAYDARDNLRSVTDPDGLATNYTYDGLNNLTDLNSPDTGHTGYTYDAAGNRKTQTDARGVTATYSYDALNRLTGISYPTTSLNVTYAYDQPAAGCYNIGRLTTITDSSGSTTYCYDRRGNVLQKRQMTYETYSCNTQTDAGCGSGGGAALNANSVKGGGSTAPLTTAAPNPTLTTSVTLTTTYTYSVADRLLSITYPSGAIVTYGRDSIGRITSVSYKANANASSIVIASNVTYYPFGPQNVITFGNGRTLAKTYDGDYAIDKIVSSNSNGLVIDATVDALGNLTNASSVVGANPPTQVYQYDPLYRLTAVQNGSGTSLLGFTYDLTGDRLSKTPQGQAAQNYTYASGTHHLATVNGVARSYDANGNTLSGPAALSYDDRNRLSGWNLAGGQINLTAYSAVYGYTGRGERVSKQTMQYAPCTPPTCNPLPGAPTGWLTGTEAFSYDEAGHLLGEYPGRYSTGIGTEYVYLDGTPVAYATGGTLYYIETDQLGTPRQVVKPGATTAGDTTVWKWEYFADDAAFGENPPSVQTIPFNLRFPGQYFDAETGLNYNYFRDYEPATGRYVESDPKGLKAGINTYAYVRSNPLAYLDPNGLEGYGSWSNPQYIPPPPEYPDWGPPKCSYYDDQCKNCKGDSYACSARKCCESFGDNPPSNCTRKCLITEDADCRNLPDEERNKCRFRKHVLCYTICANVSDLRKKPWDLPACKDAMAAMGGPTGGYW